MQRAAKLCVGILVAAVIGAVACGGSDSPTPVDPGDDGQVTGTYVLSTINGSAPPGVYRLDASTRLMLDTATLRLVSNSTYSDNRTTTLFDLTGEHEATNARTGTYTFDDNTVTIAFRNDLGIATTEVFTRSGRTLTVTETGVVLVFKK